MQVKLLGFESGPQITTQLNLQGTVLEFILPLKQGHKWLLKAQVSQQQLIISHM